MEDFVTFEIAKKLKRKGFSGICSHYYRTKSKDLFMVFPCEDWSNIEERVNAPTISQVLKWLREEKKIHITILVITDFSTDADNNICEEWSFWSFYVTNLNDGSAIYDDCQRIDSIEHQSYEESAIAGIEYVLDNLI